MNIQNWNKVILAIALAFSVICEGYSKTLDDGIRANMQGNFKTAHRIFMSLAEQGNASTQYNLGGRYSNGQGVPQDYKQAISWYHKAAVQGDASAQYSLGVIYDKGRGSHRILSRRTNGSIWRQ